jgi:hypothetical protein
VALRLGYEVAAPRPKSRVGAAEAERLLADFGALSEDQVAALLEQLSAESEPRS